MTQKHWLGAAIAFVVACSDASSGRPGSGGPRGSGSGSGGASGDPGTTGSTATTGTTGTTTGTGGCTGVGPACGNPITVDASPTGGGYGDGGPRQSPCAGCQIVSCPAGKKTTVSGTVFAPNGTLPLYNVIVYVPIGDPKPFPSGLSCEKCGKLNSALAFVTALSDAKGHFVLEDVPVGTNVPLVVQVGKWRRRVTLPQVTACVDNPLTDPNLTRLPASTKEGDMPKVAITTGGSDAISCMLPKVGIDKSEFGTTGQTAFTFYKGGGPGNYAGGPAGMKPAETFWNDLAQMQKYDMMILSCEGASRYRGDGDANSSKDESSFAAMTKYLDMGGRIFGTDYQYTWWKYSPQMNLASAAMIVGHAPGGKPSNIRIDTSFPKGKALADWIQNLYPMNMYGLVPVDVVYYNVNTANSALAQVWGTGDECGPMSCSGGNHPRFMTANMPAGLPPEQQCGKAVHLDAHISQPGFGSAAGTDNVDANFPANCQRPMSAAERAFAFFFFDLSSCIQKEDAPPLPPPPDPK